LLWFLQTIFVAKEWFCKPYKLLWSLQTIFVANEMVFANHIKCYGLARLFIVTRKWSCQTIILINFPPDYIYGSWSENHVNCCGRPSTRTEKVSCQTRVLRSLPTGQKYAKKMSICRTTIENLWHMQ